ncbi:hypothetical protein R6Q59_024647 [Mikania micrantha]
MSLACVRFCLSKISVLSWPNLILLTTESFSRALSSNYQITRCRSRKVRLGIDIKASQIVGCEGEFPLVNRRVVIGLSLSASSLLLHSPNVESAGLPPQEIPKLCDESCEKDRENKLSDNDPGVMGETLYPLHDLITIDANPYKDLVLSFVNILKQVAERRLPKSYDYHQTLAPFIQAVKKGGTIFASQYLFTGSETTSVWLEVDKVDGHDVDCKINNFATLAGALCTLHASQIHIDLPTLTEKDKMNEKLNEIIKEILKEKEEKERLNGIIAELEAEKEKHKVYMGLGIGEKMVAIDPNKMVAKLYNIGSKMVAKL